MRARGTEDGVILVNVLVTLAIASSLVVLMLTSQDSLLDRARRVSATAQAEALALGAETSVLVALRRDMEAGPETDHYAEAWALASQQEVELETGRFSVEIRDAHARLDLNGLAAGGIAQVQVLSRLIDELELPPETGPRILTFLRDRGPAASLEQIPGLDAVAIERLRPVADVLPVPGKINLNTADAQVIGAVLQSRTAARRLVALRERNGGWVESGDVAALGLIGAGVGLVSDLFDVTVRAEVDGMEVHLESRLQRRRGMGTREVVVISRRFGPENGGIPTPDP
ncbi:general secretion pathway protein GspK [Limimaricola cinnabarinus]|uniref:Type II secretion system protein K n=1 Tax=Limimaricola cinnabarinus LL-001 TaxID=1337093 RepID=U3ALU3_9RHOB|nr:type II secretion system protein GspK [Limimaricola cinnabarinus]GAD55718.1 general secretion pathway protein K [Limimaricola cinnabarinus LL-001]